MLRTREIYKNNVLFDTEEYDDGVSPVDILSGYRYQKEIGGITVNGVQIQTDRESRAILTGAYVRAKEDNAYIVRWKTPAGFVTLNAAQIIAISDAVADHVQKCYAAEADVYSDILTMTSKQDVETAFDQSYLM